MLELDNVARHFGGVKAVDGLSLKVHPGEILGLIGPNGSGKSTTVNLIAGLYKPSGGAVRFQGKLRVKRSLVPELRAWWRPR